MSARSLLKDLYSTDPATRWTAVLRLGEHAEKKHDRSPESVRELLRRLAWSLNEESGATGWGAPEAMGEILARVPALAPHFPGRFLAYLSHEEVFLDNEILDGGTIWALGRLRGLAGGEPEEVADVVHAFLAHPAPSVRGITAWTAGRLGLGDLRAELLELREDKCELVLLKEAEVVTTTVAALAEESLRSL